MYPTFDSGGHFGKDALLTSEMDRDGLRVGQPRPRGSYTVQLLWVCLPLVNWIIKSIMAYIIQIIKYNQQNEWTFVFF